MGTSLAAEPLLSLAVTVTSEQRVESVLQSIVRGLASQPGVALARIWLLPSVHHPSFYQVVLDPPDCLCLVASAGTPINSPGEDWCFLQGHFARVRFNVGKVGQVAASRHPIFVKDVAAQNDWVVRPEWAKREEIRSFAGHPLIFRHKLLGVIAVFSRQPLGQQEFTWLGLFANQAAVAIANACAERALRSSERNLAAIINAIPTAAWTARSDGSCDFINQGWLDYAGTFALLNVSVCFPGLNGLDLQKSVAVEWTNMRIIFITGYGDVPKTVQAMKAGAVEFLTKPFNDEVLLTAIRQALDEAASLSLRRRRCRNSGTVMPHLLPANGR